MTIDTRNVPGVPTQEPVPDPSTGSGRRGGTRHRPERRTPRALTWAQLRSALPGALRKLDPRVLYTSPVMFVVEVGALVTTVLAVIEPDVFAWWIAVWLWATVLFATLAESVAESRGKAQASTLRATQKQTTARKVDAAQDTLASVTRLDLLPTVEVPSSTLQVGDVVVVAAGETVPGDGDVIEGVASIDESAITGESAPVIRESGGDRSAVTGGTVVLSDQVVVRITAPAGATFVDRMIALVEGSERQKTPNEVALNILLTSLTIVFLLAVATLQPFAVYSGSRQSLLVLVALLVCLIPTTIGALLSAIGIAGMDRLVQRNVLAMSGRAVEAAGDVDVLLLDKTGTITYGNRRATQVLPVSRVTPQELAVAARLASLADETPEGRSIVDLVDEKYGVGEELPLDAELVPFTAQTRMSGVDLPRTRVEPAETGVSTSSTSDGGVHRIRKGAGSAIQRWVHSTGAQVSDREVKDLEKHVDAVSRAGGTPLVVAEQVGGAPARVLGVVRLKDVVKEGMRERFDELRAMGIRSVMVTGDNAVTARAIAAEAGVDDVLAEATPEDKLALIKREQEGGKLVAMAGDGTNDAPALAQSDVGVAMNTGTSAAKEAGNMVDLDSDPTKLIEIVEIGKQLLITRGALTTFSVANDVAKYFAILPAMFMTVFPQLEALNIMHLASPGSAILSAVIFNALIILALIPLSLRGVRYRPASASSLLTRNLLIYGLGGLVAPFIGIKLIDLVVSLLPGL
ncbi:potassium-transporting ATPase subunit KdpB [Promicromonospora sukumoe]|uniref:Potassium-transporting ATPase ATP-binding subunit n=1 Tax=Promicromonospora sukumoe TaxID=88382 RepID=A0A7W3PC07_9MICO|nr:potassium-transporting ATPase subunit KdpB [Promicromonospora sukumoe]MBA8806126.1 K+-transporting ATPase ATPase B chain [Promicromonospora sukumoe]